MNVISPMPSLVEQELRNQLAGLQGRLAVAQEGLISMAHVATGIECEIASEADRGLRYADARPAVASARRKGFRDRRRKRV